jgi:hypothetical protein
MAEREMAVNHMPAPIRPANIASSVERGVDLKILVFTSKLLMPNEPKLL